MRLGGAATAVTALMLGLGLTACGGGDGAPQAAAGHAGAAQRPERRPPVGERGFERSSAAGCRRRLHGLLTGMQALRGRLAAGLAYEDYLAAVRSLRAAHSRIDVERLQLGCVSLAGAPAERALNAYIGAVNTWGDCLASASCDVGSVEPKLQKRWDIASELLATALEGLQDLQPRRGT